MAFENEDRKDVNESKNNTSKCEGLVNQLPDRNNDDFKAMTQKCFKPVDDGFSIDGDAKSDKGTSKGINKCGGDAGGKEPDESKESGDAEGKAKKIVKDGGAKDGTKHDVDKNNGDKYDNEKEDMSTEKGKKIGKVPNQDGGLKPWFQDGNGKPQLGGKPQPTDKFEPGKPGKDDIQLLPEYVKPLQKPYVKPMAK